MDYIQQIEHKNKIIRVFYDEDAESPEFETLIAVHDNRYLRGDLKISEIDKEKYHVFPLYMYVHSGVAISLTPFSCSFDSGQVGYALVSKSNSLEKAKKIAEMDIGDLDRYLQGECYKYIIYEKCKCCESVIQTDHSCSGFDDLDYCIEQAKECV